ncbi:MAG TPA: class I SAM-dependent methyltransferase [Candidatus Limnocylindria bacterium]
MPRVLKQGQHADPLVDPAPDRALWPARQRRAFVSAAMDLYRESLQFTGAGDLRAAVLDDLSTFFGLAADECARRCIEWEQWSVEEWTAERRDSEEAMTAFYRATKSWAFDLLWYSYLQAMGYAYPVSVAIAQSVPRARSGARHLDFGSGIGATSQLFTRLGYESDLADISTSLLDFARFRLERRGDRATYLDLNFETIRPSSYDVITAVDTLVHIPDVPAACRMLHMALRPNGLLFANFDVRPASAENAPHLYDDDLPLRYQLQRAGFEPEENLDGMVTRYRRVESAGLAHALRGTRDVALYLSPLRPAYRALRHQLADFFARDRRTKASVRMG